MLQSNFGIKYINHAQYDRDRNEKVGYLPDVRPIDLLIANGIVLLDKPAGPSSHEVIAIIKRILNIKKAGHSGTLDPQVTGMLPVALLNSTKILHTLLEFPKTYICNMEVHKKPKNIDWNIYFAKFTGKVYQYPPLESNVVRRLRTRTIYALDLLQEKNNEVLFSVKCESGTYIRTLCEDIGRASGLGAHMKELRRVQTGPFNESERVTLHDVFDAIMNYREMHDESKLREVILPVEVAVKHMREIIIKNAAVYAVVHGKPLYELGVLGYSEGITTNEFVAVKTAKGELIGLGTVTNDDFTTEGEVLQIKKVLMDRDLYPKY